jgi:hypothetical protein
VAKCLVCAKCELTPVEHQTTRSRRCLCPRCGEFCVTQEATGSLNDLDDNRLRVSRWIREQNRMGSEVIIRTKDIEYFRNLPKLEYGKKEEMVLEFISDKTKRLGQSVTYLGNHELLAITELADDHELIFLIKQLFLQGYTEIAGLPGGDVCLTSTGHQRAEANRSVNRKLIRAFIAMSFAESMYNVWRDGIEKGIRDAGYEPIRMDNQEHNNKICDEIIAEIRRSKFVVADFTGHRGGVYYEAGFAAGLGIPVVFTCRHDDKENIHFDVRQFNTILWQDETDLSAKLAARISATIGDGPVCPGNL